MIFTEDQRVVTAREILSTLGVSAELGDLLRDVRLTQAELHEEKRALETLIKAFDQAFMLHNKRQPHDSERGELALVLQRYQTVKALLAANAVHEVQHHHTAAHLQQHQRRSKQASVSVFCRSRCCWLARFFFVFLFAS